MKLLFKILRKGLNKGQIIGFTLANVVGLCIVLSGVQIYRQVDANIINGDTSIDKEYIVLGKPVSSIRTITSFFGGGKTSGFPRDEIEKISSLKGVKAVSGFMSSSFDVLGSVSIRGNTISTAMFLEALPDEFIDLETDSFRASLDDAVIPIIVPRSYLDMYNFGFASATGMPQIGEGLVSMLTAQLRIRGCGGQALYDCKIAGFSDRVNSILVPQDFLKAANEKFSSDSWGWPSRLMILTNPQSFSSLCGELEDMGYYLEGANDSGKKINSALKFVLIAVTAVGAVLSVLSFILLLISILMMIEKNKDKNGILSLLGYSDAGIALPYQLAAVSADVFSAIIALCLAGIPVQYADKVIRLMVPHASEPSFWTMALTALFLTLFLALLHTLLIYLHIRKPR